MIDNKGFEVCQTSPSSLNLDQPRPASVVRPTSNLVLPTLSLDLDQPPTSPRPRHQTPTSSLDLASDFATRPRPTSNFASTWTPNSERVAPPPTWSFDLDQPTSARSRPQTSTSSLDLASDLATRPPTNLQLRLGLDTQQVSVGPYPKRQDTRKVRRKVRCKVRRKVRRKVRCKVGR